MFNKPLSKKAKELLIEATKDDVGRIARLDSEVGDHLRTNKKNFIRSPGESKTEDTWQDALAELFANQLIIKTGTPNNDFYVSKAGYDLCYWPTGFGNDDNLTSLD